MKNILIHLHFCKPSEFYTLHLKYLFNCRENIMQKTLKNIKYCWYIQIKMCCYWHNTVWQSFHVFKFYEKLLKSFSKHQMQDTYSWKCAINNSILFDIVFVYSLVTFMRNIITKGAFDWKQWFFIPNKIQFSENGTKNLTNLIFWKKILICNW